MQVVDQEVATILEAESLLPHQSFDRRHFLTTTLGAGFALAVSNVSAETIITDSLGLRTGRIQLDVSQGNKKWQCEAYFARPDDDQPKAIVLVISEIFGVHEHIADICRRFAKAGYLAIAAEHFTRYGDVKATKDFSEILAIVAKEGDADVMSELDAALAWAGTHGGDANKVAVTGFCWGGRGAWLYAAHQPKVKAGAAFYGRINKSFDPVLSPTNPIDIADKLYAPVIGFYGEKDEGISLETVKAMQAKLMASSNGPSRASKIIVYPDTPHAFVADYRPSYRAEAAKDAWLHALAWFRDNGVS